MATDVTNGIGAELTLAAATPQLISIVPVPGTDGAHKSAMTCKVYNTGATTIYAVVNADLANYVRASAIPIPAGENQWFVGQPIKKLIVESVAGGTATYGAY